MAHAARAAEDTAAEVAVEPLLGTIRSVLVWCVRKEERDRTALAEQAAQAELVREVFGNPFRAPVVSPSWLAWEGGLVTRLGRGIVEDGAFDHMPVLADALEEASCDDQGLLGHLRGTGPHVRGCWVIDLLLESLPDWVERK